MVGFILFACMLMVTAAASPPPHVVFFLVDDMGWANVGFHNDEPLTPTIDALARGGAQLDRFYTYHVCSPTRSSFLSGRLPIHVNQYNHPPPVPGGGVPPEMTTIADVLNKASPPYKSHQIGKWHGGMSRSEQLPVNRGFQSSLGYLSGAEDHFDQTRAGFHDFWRDLAPAHGETGGGEQECINQTGLTSTCRYATYQYSAEAERIIRAHNASANPLFIYLAFGDMHGPVQAPRKFLDLFPNVTYAPRRGALAQMAVVDEAIMNVTSALKTSGMWNHTLVIFSSDNGGPLDHANNYPLRGHKATPWEGGVRVAAFLTGGFLPAPMRGTTVKGVAHITDLYATLADIAGVDPTDTKCASSRLGSACPPIDSLSMWPMFSGANATSPRTEMLLASAKGVDAANAFIGEGGRYKLIRGTPGDLFPGPHMPNRSSAKIKHNCTHGCLFDLIADPTEHVDLAFDPSHAAVHARMLARAAYFDGTVFQSEGGEITRNDPAATAKAKANGGFWGPWQPNKPLGPTPSPGPTPPPGPSFRLQWDATSTNTITNTNTDTNTNTNANANTNTITNTDTTVEYTRSDAGECLELTGLYKGSVAKMGACGGKNTQWVADSVGRLTPLGAKTPGKSYLRQKYKDGKPGCILGNEVSLGTDAKGSIYTSFDSSTRQLVLSACKGLCVGVTGTAANEAASEVTVVECHDAAHAQHWSMVKSADMNVGLSGTSYSYSYS